MIKRDFLNADVAEAFLRKRAKELGWRYPDEVKVMTTTFAAELLDASVQYTRRLARQQNIPCWRPKGPRGDFMFSLRALACWLAHEVPPPSPKEYWRPDPEFDSWLGNSVEGPRHDG